MSQKTFTFLVGILAPPTLRTFWAELVRKFTPLSKEISCCCQNICIVHNFMVVMFTILFYRDLRKMPSGVWQASLQTCAPVDVSPVIVCSCRSYRLCNDKIIALSHHQVHKNLFILHLVLRVGFTKKKLLFFWILSKRGGRALPKFFVTFS